MRSNNFRVASRHRAHVADSTRFVTWGAGRAARDVFSVRVLKLSSVLILTSFCFGACAYPKPVIAPTVASSDPSLTCATSQDCFEQAVQTRRNGDSDRAMAFLRKTLDQFPYDRWTARAVFLLGKGESEEGRPEATGRLERAMVDLPEIQDYALFYLGQSALRRGDAAEAMTRFDSLTARTPESIWVPQARYLSGEAAFTAGFYPQARERFDAFRETSPNDRLVPSALLYIGRSYLEQGDYEQAVSRFRQVWTRWPDLSLAQEAQLYLDQLQAKEVSVPAPTPDERLIRVRRLADALQYDQALKEAEALFVTESGGPLRKPMLQQIGSLHYQLRRFEPAGRSFETLAQELIGQPDYSDSLVWLGRVAYRMGDEERLARLEEKLASEPAERDSPGRARLLSLLGNLYEDRKKGEEAQAVYRRLVETFPQSPFAQEAAWRLGWMDYRAGRWDQAVSEFGRFLLVYPQSPISIQVLYWQAKSLERLGEIAQASSAYRQACEITRHSYYCHRAEERLKDLPLIAADGQADSSDPELSEPGPPAGSDGPEGASAVVVPPVIEELFLMGLEAEAVDELNRLILRTRPDRALPGDGTAPAGDRTKRFLALNRILTDHGRYAQALRNLKLYAPELLERIRDDFSPDVSWIAYPQGMRNEVEPIAKEIEVSPDLVTAVIREESHYDPEAVSPVGALGLMQLMPTTAHWMAKRINLGTFSKDQLHSPSVNIKLGAHYLAFLLDRFSGETISAVAAYNAGPGSVTRWKASVSIEDRDEFVETIPFQETRNFVKRVMRSYYEYGRLQKFRQRDSAKIDTGPSGNFDGPSGNFDQPAGTDSANGFLDNK